MSNIYIHIGLHKTGTTFLQKDFFPKIPHTHFYRNIHEFLNNQVNSGRVIISNESLEGNPFLGNWLQSYKNNVHYISKIFHNPSIIIGFRKHDSFLLSLYKQYLYEKGILDVNSFFDINKNSGLVKFEDLLFAERYKILKERFNRVLSTLRKS